MVTTLIIGIFFKIGDESNIIGDAFELSEKETNLNLDEMCCLKIEVALFIRAL